MKAVVDATDLKTKSEAVQLGLRTVRLHRQAGIERFRGKLDW